MSTLHDLVSYNEKHNEANGENNADGANDNHSWNHGAEGSTDDPKVVELRERQKRNFLATLLFSQGVPMICGGDEIGRTQGGNNNAYCQDNEISWFDWDLDERRQFMLDFTRRLIETRRQHPNLRRRKFFQDRGIRGETVHAAGPRSPSIRDITWLRPDGGEMADEEWTAGWVRSFGVQLSGETLADMSERGDPISDDTLLVLLNPHYEPVGFRLLDHEASQWNLVVYTNEPNLENGDKSYRGGELLELVPRSVALLRLANPEEC